MPGYARLFLLVVVSLKAVCLVSAPAVSAVSPLDAFDIRKQSSRKVARPAPLFRWESSLTAPDGREPAAIVRDFLTASALSAEDSAAVGLHVYADSHSSGGELRHVYMETELFGVPVFDGDVSAHLDRNGRLLRLQRGYLPTPPRTLAPALSPRRAVELALRAVAPDLDADTTAISEDVGPRRNSVYSSPQLPSAIHAGLVWFPVDGEARAAWRLYLDLGGARAYQIILDADDGAVLFSLNLVREADPVGSVLPAPSTPNPTAGSPVTQPLRGWPAGAGCPAATYPAGISACWTDGTATLGNNIDACSDLDGNDVCDHRAAGNQGSFVFPFTNSYDVTNDPAPDRNFSLVNAFYWTNVLHDWFYSLGFTESAGNFQADNFGRGGQGDDAVRVDIHDGVTKNQASFLTPPDGIAPRMNLGLFTGLRRDSALDGDIITHEFAHGVTSRLVGGPLDAASLYLLQSAALAEGWSDAFAFAFTGDPLVGEYVTRNTTTGIRTVRYDQSPLTFGEIGVRRATMLPAQNRLGGLPQPHVDGEIWASALWDVRAAVGAEAFPQMLVESLKLTPPRPSLLEARDAVVQTAAALGLGGDNACAVWSAFADRGMGASAALNAVSSGEAPDTAVSVFEAFDLPLWCGGAPAGADETLHFEGAETTGGWTATGLWHRSSLRAASGAFAWRFGRAGAADYNTGQREAGDLTSPTIDLTAASGAILQWDQFFRNEGFWRRYFLGGVFGPYLSLDSARIWISADEGPWRTLTHLAHSTPGNGFVRHKVNLSKFAGRTIRLRFDFDTFTATANTAEGLSIDNIRITATGAPPARLAVAPERIDVTAPAGDPIAAIAVEIQNAGGGALNWTASLEQNVSWLAQIPSAGQAPGTAWLYPAAWTPGVYENTLHIDAGPAGRADVPITITITEPQGVVAEWHLDETGDGDGVPIIGPALGATSGPGGISIDGVLGRARRFNGWTDGVATASTLDAPERFTVRSWVRLDSAPSKLSLVISAYGGSSYQGWYLGVGPDRRAIWMAATPPSSAPWLQSRTQLQPGRWHMLTATFDSRSGEAQLYVDGAFDVEARFAGMTPEPALPLTLGKASWAENYYFPGAIDEVKIAAGLASPAEIAEDFASFAPPAPIANPAVRGQWTFDEPDRGQDSSGNARHAATLAGQSISGVSGQAVRLDGASDAILIPAHEQLAPNDFTVAFWARLQGESGAQGAVLASELEPTAGWAVELDAQGRIQATLASSPHGPVVLTTSQTLPVGEWKRIALAYRSWSRTALLYVDGELALERWLPHGVTPRGSGEIVIGRAADAPERFARFDLDELTLVPRPWSAVEAAIDHSQWSPPPPEQPTSPIAPPPDEGALVAQWDLDELSSGPGLVLRDSVGAADALTAANRSQPVQGLDGPARRFGGHPDSASIDGSPSLHSSSFSYSTWIRIDEAPDKWGVIYSTADGAYSGWTVGVYKDARVFFSVAGPPDSQPWLLSATALRLGRWHHVAVTLDGASRRAVVYLDGVRSAGATFPSWRPAHGADPAIGRGAWGQTGFLKFTADRMRLYDYERSALETAAEFAEFEGRRRPDPIGVWEMDDALSDAGTSGLDGELLGGGGTVAPGRFGDARRFGGRPDAGRLPASTAWSAESFTFSAWIQAEASPSGWGILFSTYDGDHRGWYVGLQPDGRVILCVAGRPSSSPWLVSQAALTPGRWTHLAVTFDGVSRQGVLYIDGSLEASATFPAFTPSSNVAPTIGKASWTDSYYLPVTVDRMRVEPMALSVQQILQMVME